MWKVRYLIFGYTWIYKLPILLAISEIGHTRQDKDFYDKHMIISDLPIKLGTSIFRLASTILVRKAARRKQCL